MGMIVSGSLFDKLMVLLVSGMSDAGIHPIKPLEPVPTGDSGRYFYLLAFGLFLIAALFLGLRRKQTVHQGPRHPHTHSGLQEKILSVINDLEADSPRNLKESYGVLSDLLRRYLEDSVGIQALTRSTEEIEGLLKEGNLEGAKPIAECLNLIDRVKFSDFIPDRGSQADIIRELKEFILIEAGVHSRNSNRIRASVA